MTTRNHTSNSSNSNVSDEERRKNEISMFAAMALGDWGAPTAPTTTTTAASLSAAAAAAAASGGTNMGSFSRDDRDNEDNSASFMMNITAKKSHAVFGGDDDDDGDGYFFGSFHRENSLGMASQQRQQRQPAFQGGSHSSSSSSNANAPLSLFMGNDGMGMAPPQRFKIPDETGSFAFDSAKPVSSMEKSNINAALAAFEKEDSAFSSSPATMVGPGGFDSHPFQTGAGGGGGGGNTPFPQQQHAVKPPHRAPQDSAPMFAEQVIMPRPLFFGPLVPPRVVRQARQMVIDAVAAKNSVSGGVTGLGGGSGALKSKLGSDRSISSSSSSTATSTGGTNTNPEQATPSLEELPGSVRNIVGALRVYGYGIDVLQDLKDDDDDMNGGECFWKGSPYVTTYQPVWGEPERAKRLEEIKKIHQERRQQKNHRPAQVSRSFTAPGRMAPNDPAGASAILVMDLDEGDEEEEEDDSEQEGDNDNYNSLFFESKTDPLYREGMIDQTHVNNSTAPGETTAEHFMNDGAPPLGGFLTSSDLRSSSSLPNPLSYPSSSQSWSPRNNNNSNFGGNQTVPTNTLQISANEQFSAWIRAGDDDTAAAIVAASPYDGGSFIGGGGGGTAFGMGRRRTTTGDDSGLVVDPAFEKVGGGGGNSNSNNVSLNKAQPLTEQELFSQWARGETGGAAASAASSAGANSAATQSSGSSSSSSSSSSDLGGEGGALSFGIGGSKMAADHAGTFQIRRPQPSGLDSDDDSVEHNECKKKVGINDHLSKALASLEDPAVGPSSMEVLDDSQVLLSHSPTDGSGRPLSNYELTSGCVPVYGVDDPPLPIEGDLGLHETREEQMKYQESKRAQEIVEKFVKPNIFGPVACPNPALGPDDFHSWNARVVGNQRLTPVTDQLLPGSQAPQQQQQLLLLQVSPQPTKLPHAPSPQAPSQKQDQSQGIDIGSKHQSQPSQGQLSQSSNRSETSTTAAAFDQGRPPRSSAKKSSKRKLPSRIRYGWWNVGNPQDWPATASKASGSGASSPIDLDEFETMLDKKMHLPPLHHSATALQVVTQLEPTPGALWKNNLPLSRMHAATAMAQSLPYLSDRPPTHRYLQIDTQAVGFPSLGGEVEPLFCSMSIYNIESVSGATGVGGSPLPDVQRCGRVTEVLNFDVFSDPEVGIRCENALCPYDHASPFAKLLNVPDQIDSDPNARRRISTRCGVFPLPSNLNFANLYAVLLVRKVLSEEPLDAYLKVGGGPKPPELEKLRSSAEKACQRQSPFLLPFAFGVAPLLQVFGGSENSVVTTSRAVQIPLFRFSPGHGDRQIIEHVMVMLGPREQRALGAGTPVAATNGGTAMLVMRNFGYLGLHQVVDKSSSLSRDRLVDFTGELQLRRKTDQDVEKEKRKRKKDVCVTILPDWKPDIIAEPVEEGGRYLEDFKTSNSPGHSSRYAQELAPIRLQLSPSLRMASSAPQGLSGGRTARQEIEPFYHTCFCNEMLLQPRLLHNCPKGNIVIKAELRELEWNDDVAAYFAHLPRCGPSFHNNRRGPFLVQSVLTSCSPRGSEKHFVDELKLKLPLDLRPDPKSHFSRTFCLFFTVYQVKMGSKSKWKRAKKIFAGGDVSGDSHSSRVDQIASGFFPICRNGGCLIDDGVHDVRIPFFAQSPPPHLVESGLAEQTSLVLVERPDGIEGGSVRDHSFAEDTTISNGSGAGGPKSDGSLASTSDYDSRSERGKSGSDPVSLSVRICVNSSLHSQNPVLADFLHEEVDAKRATDLNKNGFLSKISLGQDLFVAESGTHEYSKDEERLLRSTLDLVKYSICPVPKSHTFLLRAMTKLWRTLVMGTGEANLGWANPATQIPLRLHAFATLLHLLGGSSLYLFKNGMTQVDGTSKWSIIPMGRVVALFFDEKTLFGDCARETFHPSLMLPAKTSDQEADEKSSEKRPSSARRKRHVRNTNFDVFGAHNAQLSPASSGSGSSGGRRPGHGRRLSDIPSRQLDKLGYPTSLSEPLSLQKPQHNELKVDSKSDFQSALRAAAAAEEDFDKPESDGSRTAKAMIQALSGPSTGSRRWMTAPSRALTTIQESEDVDVETSELDMLLTSVIEVTEPEEDDTKLQADNLDSQILLQTKARPKKTKQMRIPRSRKSSSTFDFGAILEEDVSAEEPAIVSSHTEGKPGPKTLSDDEIESAGTAFLDAIGKSIGISASSRRMASEEQRVGSSHHRKSRSKSSIDWTLIGIGDGFAPAMVEDVDETSRDFSKDQHEGLSTLKNEEEKSIILPSFADRLTAMERQSAHSARWFPFTYEVIILQWAAIMAEQRALGERVRPDRSRKTDRSGESSNENISSMNDGIAEAATRSVGVAIAGAPLLFEVIKESLGFRISSLFHEGLERGAAWKSPPLVVLDDTLFLGLEQVISMVADACLDSRNFDSWELRQMSIDVNDSIIRFLRDMFSFLAPKTVHKLTLTYLSRFVTKEGKHWQDRDSCIGLRCSWEITKLRLNAITALIRFPDFIRVNGPQMLNWSDWWSPSVARSDSFFDDILDRYRQYRLSALVGAEGSTYQSKVDIPGIHPHWLSEIVVDICLLGAEHAEPQIQQRSGALLHELFWSCSQEGILTGRSAPIASMHIAIVWKMLSRVDYIANFAPKSQLRKDLIPCVVFVLQSAPASLLRALWRKLCKSLKSKGSSGKYGGFCSVRTRTHSVEVSPPRRNPIEIHDPDVLDMFTFLNISLRTLEYEGSEENLEMDGVGACKENAELWKKEFLPSGSQFSSTDVRSRMSLEGADCLGADPDSSSTISRKWSGHDGSLVVVNAGHQLVWELYRILSGLPEGESLLNPAVRAKRANSPGYSLEAPTASQYTPADIAVFVRAASSLYLHALALRQSDIVIVRTFKVSAELIKIFGIKTFLEGVGETLQHWMRVISLMCGARRAYVRIEATDLLELILRSTWQLYGSFFRIRVPLLAVQTEVMERIVATAASRYYRDQRKLNATYEPFSNIAAEASLVPLWRTLDRIEKQPASQNVAFRGALVRMAEKLKKLYRAYIAARVLSFIQGSRGVENDEDSFHTRDHATEALFRAKRISVLRVINASEGYSKQFLGFGATTQQRTNVAHFEAVEDALINAADVFSPTELPEHRVAWLRMLADFHSSRRKFAEEATCHFYIHMTYQQAARLHGSLWSNTPFLPWTDNIPDPVHIDGDSGEADPDYGSENGFDDDSIYSRPINSFRRIFYRVANSIALNTNEWDIAANQTLFCGIASAQEYNTVSPWMTLQEMEDQMVEEAEISGDLFRKAGIIESSRFVITLATKFYAKKYSYAKLAMAYRNLERTVVSQVPPIDSSLPQEFSATLGRFYRVWFHGGAPDDLSGVEFIYRAESGAKLESFGQQLKSVIKSIILENSPIHLVLDGRTEERIEEGQTNFNLTRLGPAPLEPVRIKVTPLRPLFDSNASRIRGLPEWFYRYVDQAFDTLHHHTKSELSRGPARRKGSPSNVSDGIDPHHREHGRSYSASIFSSAGSNSANNFGRRSGDDRGSRAYFLEEDELSGVDKFCFVQPKDRSRSKDLWRCSGSEIAEKTLKVTQLQVAQSFPACVARQPVVHRLVYSVSPLEAGVDAVCQWCAVLFRTAVATSGMAVLGVNTNPGISTDAVKIVADCIHASHVKEMGLVLLKKNTDCREDANTELSLDSYDRLSEEEIRKLQLKLARLVIVFIELLHLLIARNRQLLLEYTEQRKRSEMSITGGCVSTSGPASNSGRQAGIVRQQGALQIQDPTPRWPRGQGQRASSSVGSSVDFQTPPPSSVQPARDSRSSGPIPPDPRNHKRDGSLLDYMANSNNNNPNSIGSGNNANNNTRRPTNHQRSNSGDQSMSSAGPNSNGRAESAIAVQSELQRAFINMCKSLYPKVQGILQGDTPRWLKQCAQDTYFSLGTYKQTQIPIEKELCFTTDSLAAAGHHPPSPGSLMGEAPSISGGYNVLGPSFQSPSPRGSVNGDQMVVSRGSDRYTYGHV